MEYRTKRLEPGSYRFTINDRAFHIDRRDDEGIGCQTYSWVLYENDPSFHGDYCGHFNTLRDAKLAAAEIVGCEW